MLTDFPIPYVWRASDGSVEPALPAARGNSHGNASIRRRNRQLPQQRHGVTYRCTDPVPARLPQGQAVLHQSENEDRLMGTQPVAR